jgi:PncC family amidohydrolase
MSGAGSVLDDAAGAVIRQLSERGLTLAVAESCTGGALAGALTAVPGASEVLVLGVVAYSNRAKRDVLGVGPGLIGEHGAVSAEMARAMAEAARARGGADIGVGVTGVLGPEGLEGHSPGTVFVAVVAEGGVREAGLRLEGDRETVRAEAIRVALRLIPGVV